MQGVNALWPFFLPLMRLLYITCLGLAVVCPAATDYRQITNFTGPCARELAVMAKEDDIKRAREQARALCRADAAGSCPDLWLVYAYCEVELNEPGALAVCEEVVRRLPKSAAAHFLHAVATIKDPKPAGLFRTLAKIRNMRRALEKAVDCDPDCHIARAALTLFYSLPKLLGGDVVKLKYHLSELDRRDPFHSALAKGELQVRLKNYPAAVASYREARRLDPLDQDPVVLLINTMTKMGDYSEAFALCSELKPAFPGDGSSTEKFVELSAESGLRKDEALVASAEYMATAKGVTPEKSAKVLINTALILKSIGRIDESDKCIVEARAQWNGTDDLIREIEKKQEKIVATR